MAFVYVSDISNIQVYIYLYICVIKLIQLGKRSYLICFTLSELSTESTLNTL